MIVDILRYLKERLEEGSLEPEDLYKAINQASPEHYIGVTRELFRYDSTPSTLSSEELIELIAFAIEEFRYD